MTTSTLWTWRGTRRTSAEVWRRNILPKASPEPNTGCLLWEGDANSGGYARIRINGKIRLLSRVVCALFHAPDLDLDDVTWFACHHCDTPNCINPDHLYVGNKSTNMHDDFRRGNRPTGPQINRCCNGHELNPSTTFMRAPTNDRPHGKRICKACHSEKQRRYLAKKRGTHLAR